MEPSLFEESADVLAALVPPELGPLRRQVRRYGMKVWFGPAKPPRDHYEAQVIGPQSVPEASVLALEVGFHAEHPVEADNEAVLARLCDGERRWREVLGPEPVAGAFLGEQSHWRRVSETWPDLDLRDPDLVFEIAARLTDYIIALEPVRRPDDVDDG